MGIEPPSTDSEADGMTPLGNRPVGLYLTWLALFVAAADGVLTARYSVTFVALGTVMLTMALLFVARLFHIWTFGLNTQKSGLVDTMWDLIVDCLGAAAGATAGWAYLKGYRTIPLAATILDFVRKNPKLFKREPAPQRDADKAPGLSFGPQIAPASLGPAERAGDASAQAGRMDPRI
jgi:hypothetical protein